MTGVARLCFRADLWVEGGRLLAARIDPKKPACRLLHLDPDYRPLSAPADLAAPLSLVPNDCLLAGLFVLRFRIADGH